MVGLTEESVLEDAMAGATVADCKAADGGSGAAAGGGAGAAAGGGAGTAAGMGCEHSPG